MPYTHSKMLIRNAIVFLVSAGAIASLIWFVHRNPRPLPTGAKADRVLVEKSRRRLTLFRNDRALKTYGVALGRSPIGQKEQEGDGRTPEGRYSIDGRNNRSVCHLALHISYPTAQQKADAKKRGVSPGGDVEIHGMYPVFSWLGAFHRLRDWTAGCVAVTDVEIEEIARVVPDGTPVVIVP